MYQALYRKWRPKTFDDVVGQEHITTTLKNEVHTGKLSHAYLFCGTRGTGKTTCSKILAKAACCSHQQDGNPCGECDICRMFDQDALLDVSEIDAASNSGVDNIRELREEANFMPANAPYRIYIIDECHMLSTGAFNALLKIMEEPPSHVLFILATTEIHKVPATILSRCQRFDFHRIDSGVIADRLLYIAGEESLSLDGDAASLIARLSDGGMRDALSLLDMCVTSGERITMELVGACAGLIDQEYLFDIADAVAAEDCAGAMALMEELWKRSIDSQRLCEQLIGFYRNLMVVKGVAKPEDLVPCLPEEMARYRKLAGSLPMPAILFSLDVFQETLSKMSRTTMRRTELEMALVKLTSPSLQESSQAMLLRLEKLEQALRSGTVLRQAQTSAETARTPKALPDPTPTEEEIRKTPVEPFPKWPEILGVLQKKNKALYGALANSKAYVGGEFLLVDAGEGSMFTDMMRGDSYAKNSLKEAALAVTGKKYRLGPYQSAKYEVKHPEPDKLDELLQQAADLGVDVQVK